MNSPILERADQELCLLTLNAAPALEEELIDYLLLLEEVEGFTSYAVYGHGQHHGLSTAEQVTGKRKRIQYELLVHAPDVAAIVAGLAEAVGRDIVYWQMPVSNFGRVVQN
jgi:hypothetical protein